MVQGRGFSLVESVAALTLLATTVTVLLSAQGKSLEQWRGMRQSAQAERLAQALIAEGRLQPDSFRRQTEGLFAEAQGWGWTKRSKPYVEVNSTELEEFTLSVYLSGENGQRRVLFSVTWLERRDDR